jgi:hypothetical protein
MRFTPAVASLPSSLEPHVGNHCSLCAIRSAIELRLGGYQHPTQLSSNLLLVGIHMPLTDQIRQAIISRLQSGEDSARIAAELGLTRMQVAAVKAHMTMNSYGSGRDDSSPPVEDASLAEAVEVALNTTFGLERDLQRALRANISQLEEGLRIVDGGREHSNEAGRIDILAEDPSGTAVVIELKAGAVQPEAVAQILGYMGVVGADVPRVRGILVGGAFPQRVVYAARAVPNLALVRYTFRFSFETVD